MTSGSQSGSGNFEFLLFSQFCSVSGTLNNGSYVTDMIPVYNLWLKNNYHDPNRRPEQSPHEFRILYSFGESLFRDAFGVVDDKRLRSPIVTAALELYDGVCLNCVDDILHLIWVLKQTPLGRHVARMIGTELLKIRDMEPEHWKRPRKKKKKEKEKEKEVVVVEAKEEFDNVQEEKAKCVLN
jgi:hypothetical protein